MEKKSVSRIAGKNLGFFIITIFAVLTFINGLERALWPLKHGGVLNNIDFSIIEVSLNVTYQDGFNSTSSVFYYPLVVIIAGLLYNIFILIKDLINEKNENIEAK